MAVGERRVSKRLGRRGARIKVEPAQLVGPLGYRLDLAPQRLAVVLGHPRVLLWLPSTKALISARNDVCVVARTGSGAPVFMSSPVCGFHVASYIRHRSPPRRTSAGMSISACGCDLFDVRLWRTG